MMPCHNPAQKPAGVAFGNLYFELGPAIASILAMCSPTITATRRADGFGGLTNFLWDPDMHHYAMADGETIVQVHGMSPVQFNYINPQDDPGKRRTGQ